MGNTHFHIIKAKRNEEFYESYNLDKSQFNEWAIVVLFYASMHYVDAVLYQDTSLPQEMRNPIDHKKRDIAIARCSKLDPIAPIYKNLRDRCREARYYKICFPNDYLGKFVTRLFKPTKDYLRKSLGLT